MTNGSTKEWLIRVLGFLLGAAITVIVFFLTIGGEVKANTAARMENERWQARIEHKLDTLDNKIDKYVIEPKLRANQE
jgi:predicted PurR-regulated permease PerM